MEILNIIKMLSDENRLRILNLLKEHSLCVGEIQTILNISQSNASRHLEKMKISGLIINNKKAQWIFYQLSNVPLEKYPFIKQLLYEDIKNASIFQEDSLKLHRYKSSGLCCQDLRDVGFIYDDIKF
jgi:ArsR family transcriptional regulator